VAHRPAVADVDNRNADKLAHRRPLGPIIVMVP
jgi:hypothetical protein